MKINIINNGKHAIPYISHIFIVLKLDNLEKNEELFLLGVSKKLDDGI